MRRSRSSADAVALRLNPPPRAIAATDVSIAEVHSAAERDDFIRFAHEHYAHDHFFVPPIVAERRDYINPAVNPLFQHAQAVWFIARRSGKIVGRIAALVDNRYNRFHGTRDGFFGMFESQNDPSLAAALFEAASRWLGAHGVKRIIGPVSLAFHHECGLLVNGFDRSPSMFTPYNHRFYEQLIEACGFTKMKDLQSYELSVDQGIPEKIMRLAERVRSQGNVRVRRINTSNPEADIRRIKAIYESMLKPGFGFAPMTDAEFDELVNRVRPVILMRPELSLIAELDNEPVAFGVTLPDANLAVKEAGGYLFPFGLAKLLWAARKIDRLRVLLFGIKDGFRRRGIDALLTLETFEVAKQLGYASGEIGWVQEDDRLMNRTIQATGAKQFKTYRIYERAL